MPTVAEKANTRRRSPFVDEHAVGGWQACNRQLHTHHPPPHAHPQRGAGRFFRVSHVYPCLLSLKKGVPGEAARLGGSSRSGRSRPVIGSSIHTTPHRTLIRKGGLAVFSGFPTCTHAYCR